MKIVITLVNEESGHVKIDCIPHLQKLIESWRSGNKDPALAYAIAGVEKMMAFSRDVEAEQKREEENQRLMAGGLILPNPSLKVGRQVGPTDVN